MPRRSEGVTLPAIGANRSARGINHETMSAKKGSGAKAKGGSRHKTTKTKSAQPAVALYDYQQQSREELTIREGESLQITNNLRSDGWWVATREGREGLVPASYVRVVESEPTKSEADSIRTSQKKNTEKIDKAHPSIKVLYAYQGRSKEELTVAAGDMLELLKKADSDWWQVQRGSRRGFVPAAYVQELEVGAARSFEGDELLDIDMSQHTHTRTVQVLYSYKRQSRDELTVREGDVCEVVNSDDTDWWELWLNGKTGMVPASYVREIVSDEVIDTSVDQASGNNNTEATVRLRALYDYTKQSDSELSIRAGDTLALIEKADADWWRVEAQGKRGFVPALYVEEMAAEAAQETEVGGSDVVHLRAMYGYARQSSDELTIKEGEEMTLVLKVDEDWWQVELRGRTGLVPASYVAESKPSKRAQAQTKRKTRAKTQTHAQTQAQTSAQAKTGAKAKQRAATGVRPQQQQKQQQTQKQPPKQTQQTQQTQQAQQAQQPTKPAGAHPSALSSQSGRSQAQARLRKVTPAMDSATKSLYARLIDFYKVHQPDKLTEPSKVQQTATRYASEGEAKLNAALRKKYGVALAPPQESPAKKKAAAKAATAAAKAATAAGSTAATKSATTGGCAGAGAGAGAGTGSVPLQAKQKAKKAQVLQQGTQNQKQQRQQQPPRHNSVVQREHAVTLLQATYRGHSFRKKRKYARLRRGSSVEMQEKQKQLRSRSPKKASKVPPPLPPPSPKKAREPVPVPPPLHPRGGGGGDAREAATMQRLPPPLPPPPPAVEPSTQGGEGEDDGEDEIEALIGHRVKKGVLQIKVRWSGYGEEDDEFFPFDHILQDFPDKIREYVLVHPELEAAYERGDFDTELDS